MPPAQIAPMRHTTLDHHVSQGAAWLSLSNQGRNTALLSYAAFEFRLAIEHIMLFHWFAETNAADRLGNLGDLSSFRKMRDRIRKIRGNRKFLWRTRKFTLLLLQTLKVDTKFYLPDFGELERSYQRCSDLCHIEWTVFSTNEEIQATYYEYVTDAKDLCERSIGGLFSLIRDGDSAEFSKLKQQYLEEQIGDEDVVEYVRKCGIWAKVTYNDGRVSEFTGIAVPPGS